MGGRNPETHPSPPGDIRAFDVAPERCAGDFTPSLSPASLATRPGRRMPGSKPAPPTTGLAWRSMPSAALCLFRPVRRPSISTEPIGSATISSRTLLALDAADRKAYLALPGRAPRSLGPRLPFSPALVTVKRDGKRVRRLAQTSKQGFVSLRSRHREAAVSDRRTQLSRQPHSRRSDGADPARTALPEPFARQFLTEDLPTNEHLPHTPGRFRNSAHT